jgi:hypothetical protein
VFVSICGFECHGPKGDIGIAPQITPEDFRAPFITAEGWGTFTQKIGESTQRSSLSVKQGSLSLKTLSVRTPGDKSVRAVRVSLDGKDVPADLAIEAERAVVRLRHSVTVSQGQFIVCELKMARDD